MKRYPSVKNPPYLNLKRYVARAWREVGNSGPGATDEYFAGDCWVYHPRGAKNIDWDGQKFYCDIIFSKPGVTTKGKFASGDCAFIWTWEHLNEDGSIEHLLHIEAVE